MAQRQNLPKGGLPRQDALLEALRNMSPSAADEGLGAMDIERNRNILNQRSSAIRRGLGALPGGGVLPRGGQALGRLISGRARPEGDDVRSSALMQGLQNIGNLRGSDQVKRRPTNY